jgi:c-di-AMP phosphodiesterase-like protein
VIRKKKESRVKILKERGRENQEQKFRRKKKDYQIGGERDNQILVLLSVFSSLFPC